MRCMLMRCILGALLRFQAPAFCRVLLALVVASGISYSRPAHAAPQAGAEELFRQGREALARGDIPAACGFLEASYRAEETMGTLLNLALCHESQGRVATAWAEFRAVEQRALQAVPPQAERAALAHGKAEALRPRMPRLKLRLQPQDDTKDLAVRVDGVEQPRELLPAGLPVDPTAHRVLVARPGFQPTELELPAPAEGAMVVLDVPALAPMPTESLLSRADPLSVEAIAASRARRTVGFVVAGFGGLGIVTSGILGGLALSQAGKAKDACPSPCYGDNADGSVNGNVAKATDEYKRGTTFADIATVSFVVGAAATLAGVYLVLTSSPKRTAQVYLAPGSGGAMVGGKF
jgi:hypothetical protein